MNPTPHRFAEVIKAWADGQTIQVKTGPHDIFRDWTVPLDDHRLPPFNTPHYEWRIKPVLGKYRVALVRLQEGGEASVRITCCEANENAWEESKVFVRWLTPWVEYEE